MKRAALLIRLLRCYESERDTVRRMRLGLLVLRLERSLYVR
jgi:hypothetical protein